MEKYIKHIPLVLLCLAIGKLLIFQATWEGAATAGISALLAAAYEFKNHDQKLKDLENKLETTITVVNNHAKAIEDTRSGMSAIRMATQLKAQTVSTPSTQRVF